MIVAVNEAYKGMRFGEGGPFGSVIVKNAKIISRGHNMVVKTNDPPSHSEIVAIRRATKKLKRFDLSDCKIYSSCEPCPMCLAAIYWAKIRKLYFCCTKDDAENIRFDDKFIYGELRKKEKGRLKAIRVEGDFCTQLFKEWKLKKDKVRY